MKKHNPKTYSPFSYKGEFVNAGMEAGYTKADLEESWDSAHAAGKDAILALAHALVGKSFGLGSKETKEGNARAAYQLLNSLLNP